MAGLWSVQRPKASYPKADLSGLGTLGGHTVIVSAQVTAEAPIRVHVHWLVKMIFALGVASSAWAAAAAWRQGNWGEASMAVLWALILAWVLLLAYSTIDFD